VPAATKRTLLTRMAMALLALLALWALLAVAPWLAALSASATSSLSAGPPDGPFEAAVRSAQQHGGGAGHTRAPRLEWGGGGR
jgi:hypothetical protein